MRMLGADTAWGQGRFDSRDGPCKILFGRMYEDPSIELGAFSPGRRVFCIASAGCTAMALAPHHEVVAVDINPVQLAYAARRFAGARSVLGTAERVLAFGRTFTSLAGWWPSRVRTFARLDNTEAQVAFWRRYLDTRRFRVVLDGLLSVAALRAVYASPFLEVLPRRLGTVMRERLERCFAHHSNRSNPYVHGLFLGEMPDQAPPPEANAIRLFHADASAYLEGAPAGSFDGFTLSNILDGANAAYAERLVVAVKRAAAPGAVVVLRSFAEPSVLQQTNCAAKDRSMLWGIVDVREAAAL